MPDRYKKIQRKLKPLPFIIIGVIAIAITVFVLLMKDTPQQKFYKEYYSHGVVELNKDHVFKEINYKTFYKKIKAKENMLVYFGEPTCPECLQEVDYYDVEFKEVGLEENFKYIYYINVKKLKDKEEEKMFEDFYLPFEITPIFVYFEDGEIVLTRNDSDFNTDYSDLQGQVYKFLLAVKRKQKSTW